jgi:hypothetical protein
VALAGRQAFAQEPQFAASEVVAVSQPLLTLPSQLPYPVAQLMPQTPEAQLGVPWLLLHALPQAPQFAALVLTSASQPLAALPSQF